MTEQPIALDTDLGPLELYVWWDDDVRSAGNGPPGALRGTVQTAGRYGPDAERRTVSINRVLYAVDWGWEVDPQDGAVRSRYSYAEKGLARLDRPYTFGWTPPEKALAKLRAALVPAVAGWLASHPEAEPEARRRDLGDRAAALRANAANHRCKADALDAEADALDAAAA